MPLPMRRPKGAAAKEGKRPLGLADVGGDEVQKDGVQPQHTVAHELGHILADTANEDKAEKKAKELLTH